MNAVEIRDLSKSFRGLYALDGLNMTVPVGAIYGFIGENGPTGSGKSTTEKLICGHLVPNGGEIKLFGKDYTDAGVRNRVGALIENAGCSPQFFRVGQPHDAGNQSGAVRQGGRNTARAQNRAHGGQCQNQIQKLLARHEAAHRHCHGAFGRPRAAHSGRTHQRAGYRRHAHHARNSRGYNQDIRLHGSYLLAHPG